MLLTVASLRLWWLPYPITIFVSCLFVKFISVDSLEGVLSGISGQETWASLYLPSLIRQYWLLGWQLYLRWYSVSIFCLCEKRDSVATFEELLEIRMRNALCPGAACDTLEVLESGKQRESRRWGGGGMGGGVELGKLLEKCTKINAGRQLTEMQLTAGGQ
jgi:hypothetical protein